MSSLLYYICIVVKLRTHVCLLVYTCKGGLVSMLIYLCALIESVSRSMTVHLVRDVAGLNPQPQKLQCMNPSPKYEPLTVIAQSLFMSHMSLFLFLSIIQQCWSNHTKC